MLFSLHVLCSFHFFLVQTSFLKCLVIKQFNYWSSCLWKNCLSCPTKLWVPILYLFMLMTVWSFRCLSCNKQRRSCFQTKYFSYSSLELIKLKNWGSTIIYSCFHIIVVREDAWYDFNLLKFIETFFCHRIWSILKSVLCALQKNVYSTVWDEKLWKYQFQNSGVLCYLR